MIAYPRRLKRKRVEYFKWRFGVWRDFINAVKSSNRAIGFINQSTYKYWRNDSTLAPTPAEALENLEIAWRACIKISRPPNIIALQD